MKSGPEPASRKISVRLGSRERVRWRHEFREAGSGPSLRDTDPSRPEATSVCVPVPGGLVGVNGPALANRQALNRGAGEWRTVGPRRAPFRVASSWDGAHSSDGELPVVAAEFVEGLAQQKMNCSAYLTPSRRSCRWTAWEKWSAMLTLLGPRFRQGRSGTGVPTSGRGGTAWKGFSLSGIRVFHTVAQLGSKRTDFSGRLPK